MTTRNASKALTIYSYTLFIYFLQNSNTIVSYCLTQLMVFNIHGAALANIVVDEAYY